MNPMYFVVLLCGVYSGNLGLFSSITLFFGSLSVQRVCRVFTPAICMKLIAWGKTTHGGAKQGMAEGAPLPPWLTDAQYLSPLLIAYDQSIADQVLIPYLFLSSRYPMSPTLPF